MVAEALREGLLDGIDPATMAAVVSCFTFQRRGPGQRRADAAARAGRTRRCAQAQPGARAASGATCTSPSARRACPRPAGPIPGFTAAIYAWVDGRGPRRRARGRGDDRRRLRPQREADDRPAAPDRRRRSRTRATAATARAAADACLRGVVAASSIVKAPGRVITAGRAVGPARRRPPPDLEVAGGDADLAAAVRASHPGALVRFRPDADVRSRPGAVGLGRRPTGAPGHRAAARRSCALDRRPRRA